MGNYNSTIATTDTSTFSSTNMTTTLYIAGSLHLFIGPMYAGKTTKLIDTYEWCLYNEETAIVVTHSSEIRYSIDKLSTHDKKQICCCKYDSIKQFIKDEADMINKTDTILIDEGQFFADLMDVLYIVNKLHKKVYVFGLDGDFERNKFGHILDLIPHCDSVKKLQGKCCNCEELSSFSHRTCMSDSQVLVGSQDVYQPLCRGCYNSKK